MDALVAKTRRAMAVQVQHGSYSVSISATANVGLVGKFQPSTYWGAEANSLYAP